MYAVRSTRWAWSLVHRIWLGTQARLVFDRACPRVEALGLLGLAAKDLGQRLHSQAEQVFTDSGNPDVKDVSNHLCRHCWRVRVNSGALFQLMCSNCRIVVRSCHTCGCQIPNCSCAVWYVCFIGCRLVSALALGYGDHAPWLFSCCAIGTHFPYGQELHCLCRNATLCSFVRVMWP